MISLKAILLPLALQTAITQPQVDVPLEFAVTSYFRICVLPRLEGRTVDASELSSSFKLTESQFSKSGLKYDTFRSLNGKHNYSITVISDGTCGMKFDTSKEQPAGAETSAGLGLVWKYYQYQVGTPENHDHGMTALQFTSEHDSFLVVYQFDVQGDIRHNTLDTNIVKKP